jgi:hypothetical protein
VPRIYARATEKALVAKEVEQALGDYLTQQDTAAAAWTAVGRHANGRRSDRLGPWKPRSRHRVSWTRPKARPLLALDLLMDPKYSAAGRASSTPTLRAKPAAEFRMAYARAILLNAQRYAEPQPATVGRHQEKPNFAEAWLVLGTLQVQDRQYDAAETSLKRYVELAPWSTCGRRRPQRGLAQAYLSAGPDRRTPP